MIYDLSVYSAPLSQLSVRSNLYYGVGTGLSPSVMEIALE